MKIKNCISEKKRFSKSRSYFGGLFWGLGGLPVAFASGFIGNSPNETFQTNTMNIRTRSLDAEGGGDPTPGPGQGHGMGARRARRDAHSLLWVYFTCGIRGRNPFVRTNGSRPRISYESPERKAIPRRAVARRGKGQRCGMCMKLFFTSGCKKHFCGKCGLFTTRIETFFP